MGCCWHGALRNRLKRGANNHCAYGARQWAAVGTEHSGTGPFEGPPTIKPLLCRRILTGGSATPKTSRWPVYAMGLFGCAVEAGLLLSSEVPALNELGVRNNLETIRVGLHKRV